MNPSYRLKLLLSFAATYVIWGSTFLAIRYAIDSLPGFTMAAMRHGVGGLIFLLWARFSGEGWPRREYWAGAFVLGFLLLVCGNGGVVWAEQYVPTGLTALLVGTEPLSVALLLWLTHPSEKPSARTVLGVLVGFAGAALLALPGLPGAGQPVPIGPALVVMGAAFSWAAGSLYGRKAQVPRSVVQFVGMQMVCGAAMLFVVGGLAGEWRGLDLAATTARSWWALVYLTACGSFLGFTAYNWLVRNVAPALVATYAYVNPLVAVLLGWLLLGEPVGLRVFFAGALVITSVVLVSSAEREARKGAELAEASAP